MQESQELSHRTLIAVKYRYGLSDEILDAHEASDTLEIKISVLEENDDNVSRCVVTLVKVPSISHDSSNS